MLNESNGEEQKKKSPEVPKGAQPPPQMGGSVQRPPLQHYGSSSQGPPPSAGSDRPTSQGLAVTTGPYPHQPPPPHGQAYQSYSSVPGRPPSHSATFPQRSPSQHYQVWHFPTRPKSNYLFHGAVSIIYPAETVVIFEKTASSLMTRHIGPISCHFAIKIKTKRQFAFFFCLRPPRLSL